MQSNYLQPPAIPLQFLQISFHCVKISLIHSNPAAKLLITLKNQSQSFQIPTLYKVLKETIVNESLIFACENLANPVIIDIFLIFHKANMPHKLIGTYKIVLNDFYSDENKVFCIIDEITEKIYQPKLTFKLNIVKPAQSIEPSYSPTFNKAISGEKVEKNQEINKYLDSDINTKHNKAKYKIVRSVTPNPSTKSSARGFLHSLAIGYVALLKNRTFSQSPGVSPVRPERIKRDDDDISVDSPDVLSKSVILESTKNMLKIEENYEKLKKFADLEEMLKDEENYENQRNFEKNQENEEILEEINENNDLNFQRKTDIKEKYYENERNFQRKAEKDKKVLKDRPKKSNKSENLMEINEKELNFQEFGENDGNSLNFERKVEKIEKTKKTIEKALKTEINPSISENTFETDENLENLEKRAKNQELLENPIFENTNSTEKSFEIIENIAKSKELPIKLQFLSQENQKLQQSNQSLMAMLRETHEELFTDPIEDKIFPENLKKTLKNSPKRPFPAYQRLEKSNFLLKENIASKEAEIKAQKKLNADIFLQINQKQENMLKLGSKIGEMKKTLSSLKELKGPSENKRFLKERLKVWEKEHMEMKDAYEKEMGDLMNRLEKEREIHKELESIYLKSHEENERENDKVLIDRELLKEKFKELTNIRDLMKRALLNKDEKLIELEKMMKKMGLLLVKVKDEKAKIINMIFEKENTDVLDEIQGNTE